MRGGGGCGGEKEENVLNYLFLTVNESVNDFTDDRNSQELFF